MNKSMVLQSKNIENLLGYIYPDSITPAAFNNSCEDHFCSYCNCEEPNMASVPQAAFAAKKIRQNEDRIKLLGNTNPMNYSSKYMNSIWGQYNRYSVHNLKKIMEKNSYSFFDRQIKMIRNGQTVEKSSFTTDTRNSINIFIEKLYN